MNTLRFLIWAGLLSSALLSLSNLWASSPPAEVQNTTEGAPVFMGIGEQRILNIKGLTRFSIGAPLIKAVSPREFRTSGSTPLLIRALSPGVTDLWVWKKDGATEHRHVRIEKNSPELLSPSLKKSLSSLLETEVVFSGAGILLTGSVEKESEAFAVSTLARTFPKEVIDETTASPQLKQRGLTRLNHWLKTYSTQGRFQIEERAEQLYVVGSVESPSEAQAIERKLRTLYPFVRMELESLPDSSPTVHFKVFLLEVKKSLFRSFGLAWPATLENAFRVTTSSLTDGIALDLAIHALEGEGGGKLLSSPELVVRAPGEAELFSGGELPIHVQTQYFSNVSWKSFGLMLKLKVTHSTAEKVRLEIATEVSHLDATLTQSKTPGIQANRMKTQIDARYGTPLFLSGLLQEGTRESLKGLPLLHQIPILGKLFGSEDFIYERSELVAILLPTLHPPRPPMERLSRLTPRGKMPLPRNYISPEDERRLRASSSFPWNVFQ